MEVLGWLVESKRGVVSVSGLIWVDIAGPHLSFPRGRAAPLHTVPVLSSGTLLVPCVCLSGAQPVLLGWGASRHGQLGPCTPTPDKSRGVAPAEGAEVGEAKEGPASPAGRLSRRQQGRCAWVPQRLLPPEEPGSGPPNASDSKPGPQARGGSYHSIAAGGDQSALILGKCVVGRACTLGARGALLPAICLLLSGGSQSSDILSSVLSTMHALDGKEQTPSSRFCSCAWVQTEAH